MVMLESIKNGDGIEYGSSKSWTLNEIFYRGPIDESSFAAYDYEWRN